ncbi:MAG: hypothetical protein GY941_11745 [Planctomycetes bacterium]|nr:hypothetical protein [Planctomycetota bacterium]
MARQWRIEFEGAYYHILSRGNERRNIFRDNDDRVSFLEILGMMSNRFEIEVCAYVLMDNHITYVKLHINGVMSPEIVI